MTFFILHAFTVFCSFPIIIGDTLQRISAVTVDQLGTDGAQFVKRIVHGEKISDNPGYLVFTAPYKLCEGGCDNDEDNFAMAFPIYVGKKGKEKYKELYERDYKKIHATKQNAPFKKRPTTKMFTLCSNEVSAETTLATTETEMTLETITIMPTTPTVTVTEADSTVLETIMTETTDFPFIKTPTVTETDTTPFSTSETQTESQTTIKTTVFIETVLPTVTDTTTVSQTEMSSTLQETEPTIETTSISKTEIPEATETEDITFEAYEDDDNNGLENEDTTFITNAKGIRCPSRICRNKIKVTPSIITLVRNNAKQGKLNTRNAQWNSDYSDLQDYSGLNY